MYTHINKNNSTLNTNGRYKHKPTDTQIKTHGYKTHKHTNIKPQIPKSKFHFPNPQT